MMSRPLVFDCFGLLLIGIFFVPSLSAHSNQEEESAAAVHIRKHVMSGQVTADGHIELSNDFVKSMPQSTEGFVRKTHDGQSTSNADIKSSNGLFNSQPELSANLVRKTPEQRVEVGADGKIWISRGAAVPSEIADEQVQSLEDSTSLALEGQCAEGVPEMHCPESGARKCNTVNDCPASTMSGEVVCYKPSDSAMKDYFWAVPCQATKTPPDALTGFSYVGYGQCNAWNTRQFMGLSNDNLQCKKRCENRGLGCGGYSIMDDKFTGIRDGHGNTNRSYASNDNRCYWFQGTVTGVNANAQTQGTHGFYTEVAYCYGRQTSSPTEAPTASPTDAPTVEPTESPTESPTDSPTGTPTDAPTESPTDSPTGTPTDAPTESPTDSPTDSPTAVPPTFAPSSDPNKYWYSGASGGWGGECTCPNGAVYIVGDMRIHGQMTIACWNGAITKPRTRGYANANGKKGWEVNCSAATDAPDTDNYFLGLSGGWGGECRCEKTGKTYIVGDLPGNKLACYGGTVTKGRTRRYAAENGKKGWEVNCAT